MRVNEMRTLCPFFGGGSPRWMYFVRHVLICLRPELSDGLGDPGERGYRPCLFAYSFSIFFPPQVVV